MLNIGVVNESSRFSNHDCGWAVYACQLQGHHFAPAWEVGTFQVLHFDTLAQVPRSMAVMAILDNADQAGALGYHDRTPDGRPYGRIFAGTILDNGGTPLEGDLSVASVLSHEVLELAGDQAANRWADDGNGTLWALEACDPVESDSYPVQTASGLHVMVSNFVLPAFFDPGAPGPYDLIGRLTSPLSIEPGGYAIVASMSNETQKWERHPVYGANYPEWRKALKEFPAARTARRLARLDG